MHGTVPKQPHQGLSQAGPVQTPSPAAKLAEAGLWAQKVLVNETVSGFIGTDVVLHCNLVKINHTRITQVTWQKASNGSKQNVAIYNPNMGVSILPPYEERVVFQSPSITDGTIKLSNLQLDDEGIYIYEPEVRIDGFDSNWYLNRKDVKLTCISDANPPATEYQWKMLNGSLPDSAEIQNSTLFFKGPVTNSLSATYICEATNTIGTRSGQVEVNVT
ncbi:hypothetical protein E2320_007175, partial [Naja naja]